MGKFTFLIHSYRFCVYVHVGTEVYKGVFRIYLPINGVELHEVLQMNRVIFIIAKNNKKSILLIQIRSFVYYYKLLNLVFKSVSVQAYKILHFKIRGYSCK